jgi:hypothetical protein
MSDSQSPPRSAARSGAAAFAPLVDLAVGTAEAGIRGLARGTGVATRLAARPVRAASNAQRTATRRLAARRVSADSVGRLRESGQALRTKAQAAALRRVRVLVPLLLDAVLDQVDLTELVVRRVDLDRVAFHLDVDAIAARLDLLGLAGYVVDGIDLPKIIRESTGSVASEGVRGVRMQSIEADQALAKAVDRVLLRRRPRRTDPKPPEEGHGEESFVDGAGR